MALAESHAVTDEIVVVLSLLCFKCLALFKETIRDINLVIVSFNDFQ